MRANHPRVSVTIVTFNSERYIARCLSALEEQDLPPYEIIVVDNASSDSTRMIVRQFPGVLLIANDSNVGFSAGQNQAIRRAAGEWVLCLNPDTVVRHDLIQRLLDCGSLHASIGIVCPKILRMRPDGTIPAPPVLDSAGAYFTPWLRHHDRGSEAVDDGQFDKPEYVFGYTGAVVLFRSTMIDNVSINGEFMDEDFFCYREDADVSWRAQLLGWRCAYTPFAVAYHVRTVLDNNRSEVSPLMNMHSTKNRFLMRIKNMTPGLYARVFVPATIRDLGIVGYVLLHERSSLTAFWLTFKLLKRMWRKRRLIQARRLVPGLADWFQHSPSSRPLEPKFAAALERSRSRVHEPASVMKEWKS